MDQHQVFREIDIRFFDEAVLDELPFGVLQLDRSGKVLNYNEYESGLSGFPKRDVIGRNFFTEIAPAPTSKSSGQIRGTGCAQRTES